MKTFRASLDRFALVVTTASWAVLLATGIAIVIANPTGRRPLSVSIAVATVLPLFILLLIQPRAYESGGDGVRVIRWLGPLTIPRRAIAAIGPPTKGALQGLTRRFASGGLHGYVGAFGAGPRLLTFWATRRDTLIVIERHDLPPLVISPNDPSAFLDAYRSAAHKPVERQP